MNRLTPLPWLVVVGLLVGGCGSSGSSTAHDSGSTSGSTSPTSASSTASVAPATAATLHALLDAAGPKAGTPSGPVDLQDLAGFKEKTKGTPDEDVVGLDASAVRTVKYASGAPGVQAVLHFVDPGSATADAARAAAAPLDQGTKNSFSVPGIPGSAGYDHVIGGTVVSRDLFFSIGPFELRLGCAENDQGQPTRAQLTAAALAWYRAAQPIGAGA